MKKESAYPTVRIATVSRQLPRFTREQKDVIPWVEHWLNGRDERFKRKVVKIFEGAGVEKRYSIMEPAQVFSSTSFEDKNRIYVKGAKALGRKVLKKALEKAGWEASSLDFIITVSCTGIMIPSLDAYLINDLGLRQDITRLPVTEMGCAAGISGLIYGYNFLKAHPGKRAAIIAVESPTSTFQLEDFSMANMISAAIFGDGAACALISSEETASGPAILGSEMYHFPYSPHLMGFDLTNQGLKMILDPEVPKVIAGKLEEIIFPFLEKHSSSLENVKHFIFHPGGRKIVQAVEDLLGQSGKDIKETKEVLRLYGNMSSATVLYVLELVIDKSVSKGEQGLMLSFGPGFSAQKILLEW